MENGNELRLFNSQRKPIGILRNAFGVQETREMNKLWTLSFKLPLDDPKLARCKAFSIVQVGKTGEKYRIFPKGDDGDETPYREFYCEHVLSTLLDKVLRGLVKVGGYWEPTPAAIRALLAMQDEPLWVLGDCDFNRFFEYSFENEKILPSLFSLPNCFASDFMWKTDTSGFPWVIHLKLIDKTVKPKLSVMYGVNRLRLTKAFDWTKLYTKLYALGAGDGINQLTLKSYTNNLDYVMSDPSVIAEYGVREGIFVDKRFTIPESLHAAALAKLRVTEKPSSSYESDFIGAAEIGDLVDIVGHEKVFIIKKVINYDEVDSISYSFSTELGDIVASVSSIAERVKIEALYSQGATNMFAFSAADNGDTQNPVICDFWVPENMLYINRVVAKIRMSAFRSYSKAAKSSGGSSQTSSANGGGSRTSEAAGGVESTSGAVSHATMLTAWDSLYRTRKDANGADSVPAHYHLAPRHYHTFSIEPHTHLVSGNSHSHSVDIPEHEHDIEAGIFETGSASAFDFLVNGVKKQSVEGSDLEIDVSAMLADADGKISRGAWHTISVLPNDLARVSIALVLTGFITSKEGGSY
jgi:phage minor structural protein